MIVVLPLFFGRSLELFDIIVGLGAGLISGAFGIDLQAKKPTSGLGSAGT